MIRLTTGSGLDKVVEFNECDQRIIFLENDSVAQKKHRKVLVFVQAK